MCKCHEPFKDNHAMRDASEMAWSTLMKYENGFVKRPPPAQRIEGNGKCSGPCGKEAVKSDMKHLKCGHFMCKECIVKYEKALHIIVCSLMKEGIASGKRTTVCKEPGCVMEIDNKTRHDADKDINDIYCNKLSEVAMAAANKH